MTNQRLGAVKLHAILAGFCLPVGVMFFVTGALYTWGNKGSYETEVSTVALQAPLVKDAKDQMHDLVLGELEKRDLEPPTGGYKVKGSGTSFYFEWTGSNRDVTLEPTRNPLEGKLQIKDTTLHRRLVQLHKAKGGKAFKVLAAVLTGALLMLFASGFLLAWRMEAVRKLAIVGVVAGVLVFVIAAITS